MDGRLDVLDEGGAALVVGGRVAVQAADVVGLPSGAGHCGRVARSQPPGTRRRGAAADQADHLLGLLSSPTPPPPIGGLVPRQSLARFTPWLLRSPRRLDDDERERVRSKKYLN